MPGARESAAISPGDNRHGELAHRQRGENAQRRLRAHARHLTELFEHRALLPGGEAEQLHGVLAYIQIGVQLGRCALFQLGERIVCRGTGVAHAAAVDDRQPPHRSPPTVPFT